MAWTASVTQITKNETNVVAVVDFVEGVSKEKITRQIPANDLTPASLAAFCQRIIEGLEIRDAALAALAAGPIVLPRDRAPTPDETKQAATDAFFVKLNAYNALLVQADKGIILSTDPAIAAAAAAMKAAFLPEYTNDSRWK